MSWQNTVQNVDDEPLTVQALNRFLNIMQEGLEVCTREMAQKDGVDVDALKSLDTKEFWALSEQERTKRGRALSDMRARFDPIASAVGLYRDILLEKLGMPHVDPNRDEVTTLKWYLKAEDLPETVSALETAVADTITEYNKRFEEEMFVDEDMIPAMQEVQDRITGNNGVVGVADCALDAMRQSLRSGRNPPG